MADVTFTGSPIGRYYLLTVSGASHSIPLASLSAHGKQVTRAVGRVETKSVRMGMDAILSPSSSAGLLLEAKDVIVLEGYDNIKRAIFSQVDGTATMTWYLQVASL